MASVINASTNGLVTTGDNTGLLNIQVSSSNALTIAADKTITLLGGAVTKNIQETATISATAATGTINVDCLTSAVWYYTANASANWTFNFRGNSGTTLNSLLSTGQAVTVAFLATNGGTAYYNNVVQVDGTTVTPKYQGGTAYAAGNASSIDVYMYTIIKTGSAAFTVFTSQTKFA